MACQPLLQRGVHARLPAAAGAECAKHVGIETNCHLLFGWLLARSMCSADGRNRGRHATAGRDDGAGPVDCALPGGLQWRSGLCRSDLVGAKGQQSSRWLPGDWNSGERSYARRRRRREDKVAALYGQGLQPGRSPP